MTNKKRVNVIGRGLSTLLENPDTDITSHDNSGKYVVGAVSDINIDKIEVNPFQPRTDFDDEALKELADSITIQGIIQPLTVRKMGYDKYQLISGERRLRAAKIAGLDAVPAYIRVANDQQMLEMSLVENIQRENLNAIEMAISFQRLIEECDLTQEVLSQQLGKGRTTITNYLRLLKLSAEIQLGVRDSRISMGHARALINIEDTDKQLFIFTQIIAHDLSVRETEKMVREYTTRPVPVNKEKAKVEIPEKFTLAENQLSEKFNTKVEVRYNKGKGSIIIPFGSVDELDSLIEKFNP